MVGNGRAENITDKNVTLKWGDEDLEDSDKISLSQEVNRLIKLFIVKVQEKDSEIKVLLEAQNKGHMNFYECCDLMKKVYLIYIASRPQLDSKKKFSSFLSKYSSSFYKKS